MDFYKKTVDRKEWEFEFQQREVHPVLMSDLWIKAVRDYMPQELKLPVKAPDYLFTASYKGYICSVDKKDILEKLRKGIEDPEYLRYVFERTMGAIREFDEMAARLTKDLGSETSSEKLADIWEKVEEKYLPMIPWFWIPWYLTEENMLSDRVKNGLEKYRAEVEKVIDFNTALGILLFPAKEATFQKEQRNFAVLVGLASKDSSFETSSEFVAQSKDYLSRYAWMRTYFLLPVELLSQEELVERVKLAAAGTFIEEYEMQARKKEEYKEISEKLQKVFQNDEPLIRNSNLARELAWLLTASVEEGILATAKLIPFYKLIAAKLGVSYARWVYFTGDEIVSCLRGERSISVEELDRRIEACAVLMQRGKLSWMYGKDAKEFSEWIESGVGEASEAVSEFSGQPAYKGKVTGTVRIALTSKEAHELVSGEILVTSMTSPEYVPAMRRAAAIVTNEGGLLCHAAIMSREFGKPCIIATKIATKVLKDGDLVEVDADNGVVKIISRK